MLFDHYRKLLDFEVKPFNFDKLNSSTMKLAAFISAVEVIDEDAIFGALKGVAWDLLCSDVDKVKSTHSEVVGSSDFEIPEYISAKYGRILTKYGAQSTKRRELISEKINEINSYIKFSANSDSESFENMVRPAFDSTETWQRDFFGNRDKALQEYKEFQKAWNELSSLVAKAERAIKASDNRVIVVNDLIDKALGTQLSEYNYTKCVQLVEEIDLKYAALSAKEKERVTRYDEYKKYLVKFNAERKRIDDKWKRDNLLGTIKESVLSFLRSAWVVLLLVGLSIGVYFMTKQNWFFTAPKWLIGHDIAFYHWHDWNWKVMSWGFDLDVALIDLVAGVLGVAVDLIMYVLQGVFWLLCAVVWPLRWLLSRLFGCIFYALAYGLPVVIGAAGVTGVVFFGRDKSRIVNIVLCVVVVIMTYLCIYILL